MDLVHNFLFHNFSLSSLCCWFILCLSLYFFSFSFSFLSSKSRLESECVWFVLKICQNSFLPRCHFHCFVFIKLCVPILFSSRSFILVFFIHLTIYLSIHLKRRKMLCQLTESDQYTHTRFIHVYCVRVFMDEKKIRFCLAVRDKERWRTRMMEKEQNKSLPMNQFNHIIPFGMHGRLILSLFVAIIIIQNHFIHATKAKTNTHISKGSIDDLCVCVCVWCLIFGVRFFFLLFLFRFGVTIG